jgi:uncharacterized protein YqeY
MLREKITESLKAAMIAKNEAATATIRMVNAAIKQKDIDVARPRGDTQIKEEEILALLQGLIKSRRESVELYVKGGRQDLVDKENGEIVIIEQFLPKQMSDEEVKSAVKTIVASVGAAGIKDMGKVMGHLKTQYAGQMDMSKAGAFVREILNAA